MAYGLYGLLNDHYITDPADVLVWAVGGLVLHDGLWVPLVCLAYPASPGDPSCGPG